MLALIVKIVLLTVSDEAEAEVAQYINLTVEFLIKQVDVLVQVL